MHNKIYSRILISCGLVVLASCSASTTADVDQFLQYKQLYCDQILKNIELGESIVDEKKIPFYKGLSTELIDLNLPSKYKASLNKIADILQQKTLIPSEYEKQDQKWEKDYPNRCFFCVDETDKVQGTTEEWKIYTEDYVGDTYEKQFYLNQSIFLHHEKLIALFQQDLIVKKDQKYICGSKEEGIRHTFENF